jgi:ABC-type nitrate/sulfonate/bicarbonate transport system substrate-binding protein
MKHSSIATRIAMTVLASLFALSATVEPAAAQSSVPVVKFAYQANADWILYTGRKADLFGKAGLKVEFLQFASGREMLAALKSGDVDLATMSEVPFLIGVAQGLDLKVMYVPEDISSNHGLVVRKDSGINSIKDLKGKRVSYTRGSGANASMTAALKYAGLTDKDVEALDLLPSPAFVAFTKNDIQGVFVWQPWIEKLVDAGGKVLAFDAAINVATLQPWVVRTEWLAKNPDAARRLIAAAELARQQLAKDSTIGIREVASLLNISEDATKRIYDRDVMLSAAIQGDPSSRYSMVSANGIAKLVGAKAAIMKEAGILKSDMDSTKLIDASALKAYLGNK